VQRLDLVGKRFGRLLVISCEGTDCRQQTLWLCQCDCGSAPKVIRAANLGRNTTSCGCLRAEATTARLLKHGHARNKNTKKTTEYEAWRSMRGRCNNPNNKAWLDYGGRTDPGPITVCKRWDKYENFIADMGRKPSPDLSIDRRDNNAGYSPDNCYWATSIQQNNNKRKAKPRKPRVR
jgi:hypothetical protein